MDQANSAMTNTTTTMVEIVTETVTKDLIEDLNKTEDFSSMQEDCLENRKWWVFLLSSLLTFVVGVLSVIVVRFINFLGTNGIRCYTEDEIKQVWILILHKD